MSHDTTTRTLSKAHRGLLERRSYFGYEDMHFLTIREIRIGDTIRPQGSIEAPWRRVVDDMGPYFVLQETTT